MLYLGPGGSAAPHSHHAVQIVRSFDEPITLDLDGTTFNSQAAIVPSGLRHGLQTTAARLALALVEPLGPRGTGLERRAQQLVGQDIAGLLDRAGEPGVGAASAENFGGRLLATLNSADRADQRFSPAVLAALSYLDEAIEGRPRLVDAARAAHISPHRLTHLFTAEVGIPFRRFVLWLRLKRVVAEVSEGANLTEAAIAAGFSDSSHLSRVFRANFGLSPSALLRMEVAGTSWPR